MRARKVASKPEPAKKPAYFLSLAVENVRCFGAKQTLDLSDGHGRPAPFTILLGDNGTGKSTLLQLLVKMCPIQYSVGQNNFPYWSTGLFFGDEVARNGSGSQHIHATYAWGSELDATNFTTEVLHKTRSSSERVWFSTAVGLPAWELVLFGYGASRRMSLKPLDARQLDQGVASASLDVATNTLFDDSAELINGEAWLLDADYTARMPGPGQTKARARFEKVKQLLIQLFPDDDVEDLTCEAVDQGGPTGRVAVFAKTPYGKVPLRQLSLGYRTLCAWMVDLAARMYIRYPNSANPLAEPAVVLVDEIDLHLHPRWQRQLFQRLGTLFPNVQWIVTAHSPLVVQAAPGGTNVVVLRRPEGSDSVVIERQPDAVRSWRLDQIVTSELFGLPSARSPEQDALRGRRRELLRKPRLSAKEEAELRGIEALLTEAPGGETPEEMQLQRLVREAAAGLGLSSRMVASARVRGSVPKKPVIAKAAKAAKAARARPRTSV